MRSKSRWGGASTGLKIAAAAGLVFLHLPVWVIVLCLLLIQRAASRALFLIEFSEPGIVEARIERNNAGVINVFMRSTLKQIVNALVLRHLAEVVEPRLGRAGR